MRGIFLIAGLLVGMAGTTQAHVGDRLFMFYELTDEDLAHIDLHDGSTDDWRDVLGEPSLTASAFYIAGGDYDPSDFDFQIWLGWHQATSRIYVAMECSDNIYINQYGGRNGSTHMSLHDNMQFAIDGDHSGGEYAFNQNEFSELDEFVQVTQTQAQHYTAIARTPDARHIAFTLHLDGWYDQLPYADGGGGVVGEAPTISVIEFYVTPYDRLVKDSPEQTVISTLSPGQVIGFFLGAIDQDVPPGQPGVGYSVFPSPLQFDTANSFVDGILVGKGLPPGVSAVESDSWGRIRATFGR